MISRILGSKAKSVTFGAYLLAFSSVVSGLLGMVSDRLLAGRFGAGELTDAYLTAFRIPDFLYGIFIAGAFSAAFLPMFSSLFHKEGEAGWKFANTVLSAFAVGLVAVSAVLFFAMPFLVPFMVPGFTLKNQLLTVSLSRLMLLSPILFGISAVFSSLLQYFQRLFAYALAPILYNIGIIAGIVFLYPIFGPSGLVYGVLAGVLMHAAVQFFALLGTDWKFMPMFQFWTSELKQFLWLGFPRVLSAAAAYFTPIVTTMFASLFSKGSVTVLNYANAIQLFPVGFIGVAFSLAAFPALSKTFSSGDKEGFTHTFSSATRQIMFLALPMSFLLFILRAQTVRLILGTGKFNWEATRLTAAILGVFAFAIVFEVLIPFLLRVFFAAHDTKTPTAISIVSFGANILFIVLFTNIFSHSLLGQQVFSLLKISDLKNAPIVALPFALALSSFLQCALLIFFLQKHVSKNVLLALGAPFFKILLCSVASLVAAYATLQVFGSFIRLTTGFAVLAETALAALAGLGAFALSSLVLKCRELHEIKESLKQQFYGK